MCVWVGGWGFEVWPVDGSPGFRVGKILSGLAKSGEHPVCPDH